MRKALTYGSLAFAALLLAAPSARAAPLDECVAAIGDIADRCQEQNQRRFEVALDVIEQRIDQGHEAKALQHADRVCDQLQQHTEVCVAQIQRLVDRCLDDLDPLSAKYLHSIALKQIAHLKQVTAKQCAQLHHKQKPPKPDPKEKA